MWVRYCIRAHESSFTVDLQYVSHLHIRTHTQRITMLCTSYRWIGFQPQQYWHYPGYSRSTDSSIVNDSVQPGKAECVYVWGLKANGRMGRLGQGLCSFVLPYLLVRVWYLLSWPRYYSPKVFFRGHPCTNFIKLPQPSQSFLFHDITNYHWG